MRSMSGQFDISSFSFCGSGAFQHATVELWRFKKASASPTTAHGKIVIASRQELESAICRCIHLPGKVRGTRERMNVAKWPPSFELLEIHYSICAIGLMLQRVIAIREMRELFYAIGSIFSGLPDMHAPRNDIGCSTRNTLDVNGVRSLCHGDDDQLIPKP